MICRGYGPADEEYECGMVADGGLDNTGWPAGGLDAAGSEASGFSEAKPRASAAPLLPGPHSLAQDWITLWQSELSAMAADPEMREVWQTVVALWAGTMSSVLQGLHMTGGAITGGASTGGANTGGANAAAHERSDGQTRAADAPGASAAAAAPDPRDAEVERLARHVAALERRLAEFERGVDLRGPAKRRPKRRPERKQ